MEVISRATPTGTYQRVYVWQWPVRVFHWVNALSIAVLFTTGLMIAWPTLAASGEPVFHFTMARTRQIHFIAGYVFLIGLLWRLWWTFMGNAYARSGVPQPWKRAWWRDLRNQSFAYLRMDFGHPHLGHNALAGLTYAVFFIGLGTLQIVTGFAMFGESDPGGFWDSIFGWVEPLMGGSFRVHMWHHLFAWGFVLFAITHVYIVVLDGVQYRNGLVSSMVSGFKFRRKGPPSDEA